MIIIVQIKINGKCNQFIGNICGSKKCFKTILSWQDNVILYIN